MKKIKSPAAILQSLFSQKRKSPSVNTLLKAFVILVQNAYMNIQYHQKWNADITMYNKVKPNQYAPNINLEDVMTMKPVKKLIFTLVDVGIYLPLENAHMVKDASFFIQRFADNLWKTGSAQIQNAAITT